MQLRRLLDYLPPSTYSRSLGAVQAFRLSRLGGPATWSVTGEALTLTARGPGAVPVTFPLALYSLGGLTAAIGPLPGWRVEGLNPEVAGLTARILLPASAEVGGAQDSVLWAASNPLALLLAAFGQALSEAETERDHMVAQMNLRAAAEQWVDLWGSYFGVVRRDGEADYPYALRIIAEVIRPRVNKFAIERAVTEVTGKLTTLYEPWRDLFRLSSASTTLSGRARLFDGRYWAYNTIDVRSDADIEAVRPIVLRNKAAGVVAWFAQLVKFFEDGFAPSESTATWWLNDHIILYPQSASGRHLSVDLILSGRRQTEVIAERLVLMELESPPGYSYLIDPVYDSLGRRYSPRTAGNIPAVPMYNPRPPATAGAAVLALRAGQYWPLATLQALGYRAGATAVWADFIPAAVPSCEFLVTREAGDGEAIGALRGVSMGAISATVSLPNTASGLLESVTVGAITGNATGAGAGFATGALPLATLGAPRGNARASAQPSGLLPAVSLGALAGSGTGAGTAAGDLPNLSMSAPAATAGTQTLYLFGVADPLVDSELYYQTLAPAWHPQSLFTAGANGFVVDLSDLGTVYQDRAGTQPATAPGQPIGQVVDQSGLAPSGVAIVAPNDAARPLLSRTNGLNWANFDGVDDVLRATFSASPGAACTVGIATGAGALISTGVSIASTYDLTVDLYAAVVINRPLAEAETTALAGWLRAKAGLAP